MHKWQTVSEAGRLAGRLLSWPAAGFRLWPNFAQRFHDYAHCSGSQSLTRIALVLTSSPKRAFDTIMEASALSLLDVRVVLRCYFKAEGERMARDLIGFSKIRIRSRIVDVVL